MQSLCTTQVSKSTTVWALKMKLVSSLVLMLGCLQLTSAQGTEIPKYGDLIFLLDSSDSMGVKLFNQLKSIISRTINQMQIGVDHYRIGLIQYNEDIDVGFSLSEFKTKNQMMNYIKNKFLFQGGSLKTGNALRKVHKIFVLDKNTRDRSKYPQVLFAITSGSSNDPIDSSISTLKQDGIQIITAGVKEASLDEMQAMATSHQLAFMITSFKDINTISKDMATKIQEAVETTNYVEGTQANFIFTSTMAPATTFDVLNVTDDATAACRQGLAMDIVLMVDVSQLSQPESNNLKNFLKKVVDGLEISESCVHVGIMVFDSSARAIATLDTGDNKTYVEQLLGEIKTSKERISNIGGAINFTRTEMFGGKHARRRSQGIPKAAILVNHRSSADNVSEAANLLHRENVKIFTVGLAQANETQMFQVASYPFDRHYLKVKTFADLSSQVDVLADILVKKILNVVDMNNAAPGRTYQIKKGCLNTELADIYLLIDGSGSIQYNDFQDIKTFLQTLVEMFDIGSQKVRVAAVQYSENSRLEFGIDNKYDRDSLKRALLNIRQLGGGTNTGAAINFTHQIIVNTSDPRDQDVPIYLIVLTDGESQDSVEEASANLRKDKINVYAIGVKEANQTQLLEIAGDHKRVHFVNNFDSLKELKNTLAQQICSAEVCRDVAADVMFLVDSSGSIGLENFSKMKTFMKTLVNKTDVGPDKVQFGIVQFSNISKEELRLNKNGTKDIIWDAIDKMKPLQDTTYTGEALTFVASYFTEEKGARPRVKNILILITDGEAHDQVKTPAESLRSSGVLIFSVGVFNAVKSQLVEISGKEELVHYLETFDTLKAIEDKLIFGICSPVEECPRVQLADILFIIDCSSSIQPEQFQTMKNFVISMVNKSEVGPKNVQFGALKYSNNAHKIFYLNEHSSKQNVIKAIQDEPSVGGDTYTANALDFSKSFFTEKHGSRNHSGVDQILIIITDGDSHDKAKLSEVSKALQDAGIILYAIGVDQAKTDELVTMAGSKGKWFFVKNFDGLNHLLPNISGDVCNKTVCETEEADLTFLMDGSRSISDSDFKAMKNFMISVIENFDIGFSKVHVGVAQYSHLYRVEFELNTHTNESDLKDAIEKINQIDGNTSIGNALTQASTTILSPSGKSRIKEGIRQILMVITDGVSQDKVVTPAKTLRKKGIDIYAIGVGKVDKNQLLQIVDSSEKIISVSNFQNLENVKKRIVRNICTQPTASSCSVDVVVAFDISTYPNGAKLFHGQSHLEAQLNTILQSMMDVRSVTCSRGAKPQVSVAFYVPNAETPVSPLFQVYSPDIAMNLRTTNVSSPLYLKSPVIKSMWEIFQNTVAGKAKMLLVFTDGLDEDVEELEEMVEDLRKKGLSALVTVALEGVKHYDDIKYIEFGRGFEYTYQMYIGMPDIGARLYKQLSHVVEKTCCCLFCKCIGERGSPGSYGPRGNPGPPGRKGVPGHSGEEGEEGTRGIPGPTGEPGEKGCPGTKGPKGNRGWQGEKNEEGENGLDGIPGEQGTSGKPGSKGEKGEQGEGGSSGAKGPPGDKGDRGFRGDSGEPGAPSTILGTKGYNGDPGVEGEPGQPGIPGPSGIRGAGNVPGRRGAAGPPGRKGDPGIAGFVGDQGAKGPQGDAGSKGTKGEKGGQGSNGLLGTFGDKGDSGSAGTTGPKGKKGEPGDSGESGSPGQRGQRGSVGEDGKPGFGKNGKKGTKGERGFPGYSGVKGEQGNSGVTGEHGSKGVPGRSVTSGMGPPGDPGQPGPRGRRGRKGDKGHTAQSQCELIEFIRQTCPCCQEKAPCPAYPTELVLALDMADGMTPQIFTRMREMVTSLLSNIEIRGSNCPVGARVAVVSYNTYTKHLIRFSDCHSQEQLLSAVKNITLKSFGRRDIGNSMRFVGRNMFKRSVRGATVRKIAVFFSNGPSEDVVSINTAVMEYSALGIIPAVIAFTPAPAIKRAFSVDDTGTFKLIDIPLNADYKPLLRTLQTCTLCFDTCKPDSQCVNRPLTQRLPMDIAFLLDSSYNMKQDHFAAATGFISTMVDRLHVSSTGDRVALVSNTASNFRPTREAKPHVEFDLSAYDNNMLLKKHLLNVSHLQGPPALGFSLQWTIENIMSKASNARKQKAIILILSGETSEWDKQTFAQASLNAKCQGYPIFVIFMGKTYNDTELMDLPSTPVDHHLLQLGRIHKPEFGYALGFVHSFLNSIRRSINKYPPPELKSKCSAIGSSRGKRMSSSEEKLGSEVLHHASINGMAKDESGDFNNMDPLLSLTVDSVNSHKKLDLFMTSGDREER